MLGLWGRRGLGSGSAGMADGADMRQLLLAGRGIQVANLKYTADMGAQGCRCCSCDFPDVERAFSFFDFWLLLNYT